MASPSSSKLECFRYSTNFPMSENELSDQVVTSRAVSFVVFLFFFIVDYLTAGIVVPA